MVSMSIAPFLLRGMNLLGIRSVTKPTPNRIRAWDPIARTLDPARIEAMAVDTTLEDLPGLARDILKGQVRGRVVVDRKPPGATPGRSSDRRARASMAPPTASIALAQLSGSSGRGPVSASP